MKKFLLIVVLAFCLTFSFGASSMAYAEEITEDITEDSTIENVTLDIIGKELTYKEGQNSVKITIKDEKYCDLVVYEVKDNSGSTMTYSGHYDYVAETKTIYCYFEGENLFNGLVKDDLTMERKGGTVFTEAEATEKEENPSDIAISDKVAELIGKVNTYIETSDGYFATTILPFLISFGSTLVLGLIVLIPYIRKSAKYKALLNVLKSQKEDIGRLETLISSTDVAKISEALNGLLEGELAKALDNVKVDDKVVAEFRLELKTILAKIDSLIKGAQNAWACSSEAVRELAKTPELSILEEDELKIQKLENYVKNTVGEAKLKEIEK